MEFKLIESKEPFCGICFLNAGNKKTVCLDENHFNQNKLFFIFTLILFYENNWFHEICRWIWNINKRKKYFSNSICTPFGLFDCPQSLYLWAFPRFFKLLKLFPREVSSNQKCWFYAAFHRIYFIKCYSFHIVFKNFSSKLVAIIQYCLHEIHGRYNLLLLLKTNNPMWLAGA